MGALSFFRQLLIATPDLSDQAVMTCAHTAETMGAYNLKIQQPTVAMRVVAMLSEVVLDVALPAEEDIPYPLTSEWSFVAVLYNNASPEDEWKVTAAPTLAEISSPTLDTGWMPLLRVPGTDRLPWKHTFYWTAQDASGDQGLRTERFLRIMFRAPTNPAGFLQIGRIMICLPWQPPNHCDRGVKIRHDERPRRIETEGGANRSAVRPRPRVYDIQVHFVSREEAMEKMYELDRLRGTSQDVAMVWDPAETTNLHKQFIHGTLESSEPMGEEDGDNFSHAYSLREALPQVVSKRPVA